MTEKMLGVLSARSGSSSETSSYVEPGFSQAFYLGGLIFQVASTILTFSAFAMGMGDGAPMTILVALTLLSTVLAMLALMQRGWVALTLFVLFVTQPVFVVYFNYVVGSRYAIWPLIFPNRMMLEPTRMLLVQIQFLLGFTFLTLYLSGERPAKLAPAFEFSAPAVITILLMCGSITFAVLATALAASRNTLVLDGGAGDVFLMVAGPNFVGFGCGLGMLSRKKPLRLLALFCLLCGGAIALSGYRSVFIFAATSFAGSYLMYRRIGMGQLLLVAVMVVIGYLALDYLAALRASGANVGDLLTGKQSWQVSDAHSKTGSAEQIAVFTAYYADMQEKFHGATYLYGLFRALPQSIYTMFDYPPRIQDILVDGGPSAFKEANLNLGAYYFAESILNFGTILAPAFTALTVAGLAWVENRKVSGVLMQMCYSVVVMLMPVFALYGSANVVKSGMFGITVMVTIYVIHILGLPAHGRRSLPLGPRPV